MGDSVNICALLVGIAAFARWTISCSSLTRRMGWVGWLGGVGILALFFSVVSPDDDTFQQELIRPTPPYASVFSHAKIVKRGPHADLSITALAVAGAPIAALGTGRLVVVDRPFDGLTHFQASDLIHSPPLAW